MHLLGRAKMVSVDREIRSCTCFREINLGILISCEEGIVMAGDTIIIHPVIKIVIVIIGSEVRFSVVMLLQVVDDPILSFSPYAFPLPSPPLE